MNKDNKLSLKEKMSIVPSMADDNDAMMCNQEAQFKYDEDCDFSLGGGGHQVFSRFFFNLVLGYILKEKSIKV